VYLAGLTLNPDAARVKRQARSRHALRRPASPTETPLAR
jgi:hypothetical protein